MMDIPPDFQFASAGFAAALAALAWTVYIGWATLARRWMHFGIALVPALAWLLYLVLAGTPGPQ